MGYIKQKLTEELTHEKTVGMCCDICKLKTEIVDDPAWYGFYSQTYCYGSDATDREWYTVCSPDCFFKFILKLLDDGELDKIKLDDFEGPFLYKMAEFYKRSIIT
jgi:hypothetical protein